MRRTVVAMVAVVAVVAAQPRAQSDPRGPRAPRTPWPTMAQFMSFAFPEELVAAKKTDRIAWVANDKGLRNVFTAAAPDFHAVRVTPFMKDNGIQSTELSISDDGSTLVFTRGGAPNREGWIPSPEADPQGVDREIWAAKDGHTGQRLAPGDRRESRAFAERAVRGVHEGRSDLPRADREGGAAHERHRQGREAVHPDLGHQQ